MFPSFSVISMGWCKACNSSPFPAHFIIHTLQWHLSFFFSLLPLNHVATTHCPSMKITFLLRAGPSVSSRSDYPVQPLFCRYHQLSPSPSTHHQWPSSIWSAFSSHHLTLSPSVSWSSSSSLVDSHLHQPHLLPLSILSCQSSLHRMPLFPLMLWLILPTTILQGFLFLNYFSTVYVMV